MNLSYNGRQYYEYKRNSTNTYTTNPRFAPVDNVVLKPYTDDYFNEREYEYNHLGAEIYFESDIAKKECLVEKTS